MIARIWTNSFARFLVVGGIAFAIDLGLLILFRDGLRLPLWGATTIAFWGSVVASFILQKYFAFASSPSSLHSIWKYAVLLGFNSLATVLIVTAFDATGAGYIVGKFVATAITTLWNFFAYKYWVFTPRRRVSPTFRDPDRSSAPGEPASD